MSDNPNRVSPHPVIVKQPGKEPFKAIRWAIYIFSERSTITTENGLYLTVPSEWVINEEDIYEPH
jgi:hypothetical protein